MEHKLGQLALAMATVGALLYLPDIEAHAQPPIQGCPVTSTAENHQGTVLQQFAQDTNAGIVYNNNSASLNLAKAAGLFQSANLPITDLPIFVCAGDFDNDGWTDFVGAGYKYTFIKLFKNQTFDNPEPNWADPNDTRTPKFTTPYPNLQNNTSANSSFSAHNGGIICGDFTGDGNQDVAFMNWNRLSAFTPKNARLWRGNGDGTFQAPYQFVDSMSDLNYLSWNINGEAADYNGDGKLDMIWGLATSSGGGKVQVFLNDGTDPQPKFVPSTLLLENAGMGYRGPAAITYQDFNNDGIKDLVASGMSTNKLRYYPGLPGGGVDQAGYQEIDFPVGSATAVLGADFTLNGINDLVVGTDNWNLHGTASPRDNHTGGYTYFYSHDGTSTPFSAGVTQTLTSHDHSAIFDLDVGITIDYDHDPEGTVDFIIADGNHSGNYYVFANRVVAQYVDCGEVESGILDLGPLADEEMVITAARISPNLTLPNGTSITFYMSNEEPANWQVANPCVDDANDYCVTFPQPVGREIRWKAEMCSDSSHTISPEIHGLEITYDYTPAAEHYRAGVVVHDGVAYVGAFRQPGERGHFYATNAGLTTTYWDAADKLDAMSDNARNIYTATTNGNNRLDFAVANAGDSALHATLNVASTDQARDVINWQRSARFGIGGSYGYSRMGAVEASTPAVVNPPGLPLWYPYGSSEERGDADDFIADNADRDIVVLFGSKDGAMHAVRSVPTSIGDTINGQEDWAFIPATVAFKLVSDMASGVSTAYPDGAPTVADVRLNDGEFHTVAITGGGNGDKSTFALDITDSQDPDPMWHKIPGGSNAGQAYSKPVIARVKVNDEEKYYAIFGSGIAFDDQTPPYTKGRVLFAIDIATGARAWKFKTQCPLTSDIVVIDTDDDLEAGDPQLDGYMDRAIFADACGFVYKVDPAKTGGGWNTNDGLGTIDSGSRMSGNKAWAMFSTEHTSGALGEERPIAGTIAARADVSTRIVLFFGTGGIESYDPSKQNEFYAVYADDGSIRSKLVGACNNGVCEKFYSGTVVTAEQVILTRTYDAPVGQNLCEFGESTVEGYDLNADGNGDFVQDFSTIVNSATVSGLYGDGGAVYFTTLSGQIVSVGTPRAINAGDDTSAGAGGGFSGNSNGGVALERPLSLMGWRQIF